MLITSLTNSSFCWITILLCYVFIVPGNLTFIQIVLFVHYLLEIYYLNLYNKEKKIYNEKKSLFKYRDLTIKNSDF